MLAASSLPVSRANSHAAAELRELFEKAKTEGVTVVLDVQSEHTIAAVGMGRDVNAPVLPLSAIKLYVAAIWWENGLGDGDFTDPHHGRVTLHDTLVNGWDAPAAEAAVRLRRKLGTDKCSPACASSVLARRPEVSHSAQTQMTLSGAMCSQLVKAI